MYQKLGRVGLKETHILLIKSRQGALGGALLWFALKVKYNTAEFQALEVLI